MIVHGRNNKVFRKIYLPTTISKPRRMTSTDENIETLQHYSLSAMICYCNTVVARGVRLAFVTTLRDSLGTCFGVLGPCFGTIEACLSPSAPQRINAIPHVSHSLLGGYSHDRPFTFTCGEHTTPNYVFHDSLGKVMFAATRVL